MLMKKYKYICISGVDGSGKSTITKALSNLLNEKNISNKIIWIRFKNYLSKILLALTRVTGHNKKISINGKKYGVHNFYSNNILSYIFLIVQFVDHVIFIIFYFHILNLITNKIIISDRGVPDTVVDWIVDTHKIKFSLFLGRLLLYLLPNSYYIYLYRDCEEIIRSRPDVLNDDKFYLRIKIYKMVVGNFFNCELYNSGVNSIIKKIYMKIK